MAIDSIENNELAALSQSRIGSKCFVDDNQYTNLLGVGIGYGLLKRTSNEKKRLAEAQRKTEELELKLKYLSNPNDDCNTLEKKLTAAQIEIEVGLKNNSSTNKLNYLRFVEGTLKTRISDLDCFKKQIAQERKDEETKTLNILDKATNTPLSTNEGEDKEKNRNKYIIYGVGGVILLLSVFLLIKKN